MPWKRYDPGVGSALAGVLPLGAPFFEEAAFFDACFGWRSMAWSVVVTSVLAGFAAVLALGGLGGNAAVRQDVRNSAPWTVAIARNFGGLRFRATYPFRPAAPLKPVHTLSRE